MSSSPDITEEDKMGLLQRAKRAYKQEGLRYLLRESWRNMFAQIESVAPKSQRAILAQLYWLPYAYALKPSPRGYTLKKVGGENAFHFPQIQHHRRKQASNFQRKYNIYYDSEIISIEKGDTVIDVGAFIGETTIPVASCANEVYSIEPSPRSFACLERNVKDIDNVAVLNTAVWSESGVISFQIGDDVTDNSVLAPDEGVTEKTVTVRAKTIEEISDQMGIDSIEYMKIEAEGAEPEIIEGFGALRPDKVAVNCDPERDGTSTKSEVIQKLTAMGYEIQEGDDPHYTIIYARHGK